MKIALRQGQDNFGRKATPHLFDTLAVLGKERCPRRLRNAIALLKT